MNATKILVAAAVLILATPVVPALAHDDDDYGYGKHEEFHDQLSAAHERAHEEGFYSRAEHRAYHRALRDLHDDYHDNDYGASYRTYYTPYRSYYAVRPRFGLIWGW
ncbi:hypothetical protein MTX26_04435 [Bradyrhizobium sp. ISRA443]|uniref:hypothetical protein n=1 Tax=unclassified Bradyrhizobium TaxID=2631580 RepID=UPI0024794EF3|nr:MULTISPECIES: hypothetical protein [unclassified Bradyrhizobium]WGS00111.1 hypothetical protein MTX23_04435 [Bradyrhizobium sp. ISRA436]WGS07000.1 hypothetical protein MTX18_04435 [Bradyrhizobium sp. ISRA437]WGS13882.1 hypothetical protein MTX26_04435 [Bradyrhizobium sp. ISRA443]